MSNYQAAGVERTEVVLDDVRREVSRSIAKHGDQSHIPMGTGPGVHPLEFVEARVFHNDFAPLLARIATATTDARSFSKGDGTITWRDILTEEVFEAYAESDPVKLRAELVQVAAVAVKMCEAIDRKSHDSETGRTR